jgi:PleD family two-component response regulator
LSAAIGIAEVRAGDDAEAVIARADRAMYEQKAAA